MYPICSRTINVFSPGKWRNHLQPRSSCCKSAGSHIKNSNIIDCLQHVPCHYILMLLHLTFQLTTNCPPAAVGHLQSHFLLRRLVVHWLEPSDLQVDRWKGDKYTEVLWDAGETKPSFHIYRMPQCSLSLLNLCKWDTILLFKNKKGDQYSWSTVWVGLKIIVLTVWLWFLLCLPGGNQWSCKSWFPVWKQRSLLDIRQDKR